MNWANYRDHWDGGCFFDTRHLHIAQFHLISNLCWENESFSKHYKLFDIKEQIFFYHCFFMPVLKKKKTKKTQIAAYLIFLLNFWWQDNSLVKILEESKSPMRMTSRDYDQYLVNYVMYNRYTETLIYGGRVLRQKYCLCFKIQTMEVCKLHRYTPLQNQTSN